MKQFSIFRNILIGFFINFSFLLFFQLLQCSDFFIQILIGIDNLHMLADCKPISFSSLRFFF